MKPFEILLKQALEKSPAFNEKMNYWVNIRNRKPDEAWVYKQLLKIYGSDEALTQLLQSIKQSN